MPCHAMHLPCLVVPAVLYAVHLLVTLPYLILEPKLTPSSPPSLQSIRRYSQSTFAAIHLGFRIILLPFLLQ